MMHDLQVPRYCYNISRNVGNLIDGFYFSATKYTFGVNPRGFWCESEMLITGTRNYRRDPKLAALGLMSPECRLLWDYVCINMDVLVQKRAPLELLAGRGRHLMH